MSGEGDNRDWSVNLQSCLEFRRVFRHNGETPSGAVASRLTQDRRVILDLSQVLILKARRTPLLGNITESEL